VYLLDLNLTLWTLFLPQIILPSLFKEDWIGTCSVDWEHKCRNAGTAGSLEILIKVRTDRWLYHGPEFMFEFLTFLVSKIGVEGCNMLEGSE
jgi:hypothetical protein